MTDREKFQNAFNEIDDSFLKEADITNKKKRKFYKSPVFYSCAAGILIIALAVPFFGSTLKKESKSDAEFIDSGYTDSGYADSGYKDYAVSKSETVEAKADIYKEYSIKSADTVITGEESGRMSEEYEAEYAYDLEKEDQIQVKSHMLTASAYDDNQNYSKWKELFLLKDQSGEEGKFYQYIEERFESLNSLKRIKVFVAENQNPVYGASVSLLRNGETVFSSATDVNGYAYLFKAEENDIIQISYNGEISEQTVGTETEYSFNVNSASVTPNTLDLMFIVDVTGSMGDELDFLKAEIQEVTERIQYENDVKVRISFVYYRDYEDNELVYLEDFSDAGQYAYVEKLDSEYAEGGGDYEEAIDVAFEKACGAKWSENSVKLIFHFFDAPIHDSESTIDSYSAYVNKLVSAGVRICPVIASGADTFTEFLARSEAILSGGNFVWLTDDSGIGGEHLDTEIDAVVEYLDDLLVRLAGEYMTGTKKEPEEYKKTNEEGVTR